MSELVTVTVRIPKELLEELDVKVEARFRSEFIRQAIAEKLTRGSGGHAMKEPQSEIKELKNRIAALEEAFGRLGKASLETQVPALLEVIAQDETDRKIISHILDRGSATTKELEKVVNLKRRMILERIKAIQERHEEKLGRPLLEFVRGKKDGKRQSWWLPG